jgi:hypothetical protein
MRSDPYDPVRPWSVLPDDSAEGECFVIMKAASGGAALLPRSISKLSGEKLELVVALQRAAFDVAEAQQRVEDLVYASRECGVSWGAIGFSVGTSQQAALKRWGQRDAEPD